MENKFNRLKKMLPKVRENIPLAPWTSFKIGGPARLFFEAKSKEEVVLAVNAARKSKVPYFILAGGTNLLVDDAGFSGLVIKVGNDEFRILGEKVIAGAGLSLGKLVEEAVKKGLTGLEPLVGIPGSVGGAIFGNAGIKERSIGDVVLEVEVLDWEGKIKKIERSSCDFDYRHSRFQSSGEIILEATLDLKKEKEVFIKERLEVFAQKRRSQPCLPSSGSVFKNPSGLMAGRLIEECGLKGKQIGKAQIFPLHANWIVNLGGARCGDVLQLISLVKKRVEEKFCIRLGEEIRFLKDSETN